MSINPMIPVRKAQSELNLYAKLGPQFGTILHELGTITINQPEITAEDLEEIFESLCCSRWHNVEFPFLSQESYAGIPFNNTLCISVDDCVCHGHWTGPFRDDQVITIDAGIAIPINSVKKLHFDAAITVCRDNPDWIYEPLNAIRGIVDANPKSTDEITRLIELYADDAQLDIVVAVTGHGIGYNLHEGPAIYNATTLNQPNVDLFDGICICVEPIYVKPQGIKQRIARTYLASDTWTIKTAAGDAATHFETMLCRIDGQLIDVVGMTAMGWE